MERQLRDMTKTYLEDSGWIPVRVSIKWKLFKRRAKRRCRVHPTVRKREAEILLLVALLVAARRLAGMWRVQANRNEGWSHGVC